MTAALLALRRRAANIIRRPVPLPRLFGLTAAALMVAIGYMDPGNWATDLEGGSRFGYQLLWVLVAANAVAILFQTLAARLGLVTGRGLAETCRLAYPYRTRVALWLTAELTVVATDLAELLGTAVAINLLVGIPLAYAALLTSADVLILMAFQRRGLRWLQSTVIALLATIAGCLLFELFIAPPDFGLALAGLVPRLDGARLYVAVGILGATVMPHNLYLHSALVRRSRARSGSLAPALRSMARGTVFALSLALLINAAILSLAASAFGTRGLVVADIAKAHELLTPLLGTAGASMAFAVALLAAGQSSTVTGTMAGQYVMQGFLNLRISGPARRLLTRVLALGPALAVIWLSDGRAVTMLLIASQVVLSFTLPFAIVPLIRLTACRPLMGAHAIGGGYRVAAWLAAAGIMSVNAWLVIHVLASAAAPWSAIAGCAAWLGGLVWAGTVRLALPPAPGAHATEGVPGGWVNNSE